MKQTALLALVFLFSISSVFPQENARSRNILIVLDGSGSMWAKAGGEFRIAMARKSIGQLLETLPPEAQLGLIAYGHRRKDDCADIEVLIPSGALDKAAVKSKLDAINPTGKTPITASLQEAFGMIRSSPEPVSLILVSDGLETCNADPCAAVRLAKAEGLPFVLHVIGLGLEEENVAQLECLAQEGGGLYFEAKDSGSLSEALVQASETPLDTSGGFFWVKGVANGKLTDLAVILEDEQGQWAAGARTYETPETNPRLIRLPKGAYQVRIDAIKMKGEGQESFEVNITEGDTIKHTADFSTGELAVKVTRNGALSDATLNVFRPEGGPPVASGRSYNSATSNPRVFTLTAGEYFLEIGSIEVKGVNKVVVRGLEVSASEREEVTHDFESGTLKVGASNPSGLLDALVYVKPLEGGPAIAQGRTYTSEANNPKAFELATGRYLVEVKQVKGPNQESFEVEVKKGTTTERMLQW
ncbi:MAG: VWA domain-containing protein [Phaeodactylibacter sp.]|nr:VWA domain-containing protein [Phaeodactylibacter sp.]MCB9048764.1 VWA domain-containing protein [Lewinellaceae bacterium]